MQIGKDENKEYVNARFESLTLQYAATVTMVLIVPLGLLYALIRLLANADFVAAWILKIILVIICFVWLGAAAIFFLLRKYWVFKIITGNAGVVFYGFLKQICSRWDEIIFMEVVSTGILFGGKMIAVKTRVGNFYFPLTMKERGKEYPKLDLLGEKWIDPNGIKTPINSENCLLYQEIQKHLKV